jgi:PAS domain S-box-containing protein
MRCHGDPLAAIPCEERYRILFNQIQDAVFVIDFEGNFLAANPAGLKLLGCNEGELKQQVFTDFVSPHDIPKILLAVKEMLKSNCPTQPLQYQVRRRDGSLISVQASGQLLYHNERPRAIQIIAPVNSNVENQVKLQSALGGPIPEAIVVIDILGKILFCNDHALRIFQTNRKDMLGGTIFDFLEPISRRLFTYKLRNRIFDRYEVTFLRGNAHHSSKVEDGQQMTDTPVYTLIETAPFEDQTGKCFGFLIVASDITELKLASAKLSSMQSKPALYKTPNQKEYSVTHNLKW